MAKSKVQKGIPETKSKLNENQEAVINYLIGDPCVAEAARKSKIVSAKQIHFWLKEDSNFKTELERRRNLVFSEAMNRLKKTTGEAVKVLAKLLQSDCEKIQLAAADKLLGYSFRSKEVLEIETRIEALEQVANAQS